MVFFSMDRQGHPVDLLGLVAVVGVVAVKRLEGANPDFLFPQVVWKRLANCSEGQWTVAIAALTAEAGLFALAVVVAAAVPKVGGDLPVVADTNVVELGVASVVGTAVVAVLAVATFVPLLQ